MISIVSNDLELLWKFSIEYLLTAVNTRITELNLGTELRL
jgi:hypothetical protein